MDTLNVSGAALVGIFSFAGMLAVFSFLWRLQRGSVSIADSQAERAVERANHAEARVDAMQDQLDALREQLGQCRAETATARGEIVILKRQLAEYVEGA